MQPHLSPQIKFSLNAVEVGMRLCLHIQTGDSKESRIKTDASPVTVADYAVQAITGALLAERFPEESLVAEESSATLQETNNRGILDAITELVGQYHRRADSNEVCTWIDRGAADPGGRFWVMDPIDGTKGFIRGGQYVIALARIEDGEIGLSVLGCPRLNPQLQPDMDCGGTILLAVRGKGAWARRLGDLKWHRLQVSDQADPCFARIAHSYEPSHTNQGRLKEILSTLGTRVDTLPMDSQAKYAMIAGGTCELLYRLTSSGRPPGSECIWDHAAGTLVVTEAGGKITDLNGKELDFTKGRTLAVNEGVLVSNGILHDAALETYQRVVGKMG
ncbi:MAG: inositol monophosphatase family protein [Anaerolineales bacterium]|nr:inositol monophosphatase family protein [Anaerolineales bacterium]